MSSLFVANNSEFSSAQSSSSIVVNAANPSTLIDDAFNRYFLAATTTTTDDVAVANLRYASNDKSTPAATTMTRMERRQHLDTRDQQHDIDINILSSASSSSSNEAGGGASVEKLAPHYFPCPEPYNEVYCYNGGTCLAEFDDRIAGHFFPLCRCAANYQGRRCEYVFNGDLYGFNMVSNNSGEVVVGVAALSTLAVIIFFGVLMIGCCFYAYRRFRGVRKWEQGSASDDSSSSSTSSTFADFKQQQPPQLLQQQQQPRPSSLGVPPIFQQAFNRHKFALTSVQVYDFSPTEKLHLNTASPTRGYDDFVSVALVVNGVVHNKV